MAKYTELFSEYLEGGGTLPPAFNQIEGFTDLFIGEFADCEIGFETESLFTLKLTHKADLIIPAYKERLEELASAKAQITAPIKTRIKSGNITRTTPELTRASSQQPFTDGISSGDITGFTNPFEVTTERERTDTETYNNVTDVESGLTPTEAQSLQRDLERKVYNIKLELLKEFKNLFMLVY